MNFFSTLSEKPWLATSSPQPAPAVNAIALLNNQKRIALKFFLAVVTVIFSLFIITFLERSQFPDFQALAGQPWQPLSDPWRLWLNTGLLVAASVAMQLALHYAKHERRGVVLVATGVALALTVQFIFAQLWVWSLLNDLGYYLASNPANSYFYLFTAVHGAHVIGGLLVLACVFVSVSRRPASDSQQSWARVSGNLKLCANYWHYLLGIWFVLFALLTSSAETYQLLAALCGF